MKINNNAIEILQKVMQNRNWHKGLIERRLAAVTKQNAMAGKLSYEKSCEILELLGWQKIKEETKATIRCIPLNNKKEEGKCVYSGKPSTQRVLFAKAY